MSFMNLLGDIRPTDVWDAGDVLGTILLVLASAAIIAVVRVRRRR